MKVRFIKPIAWKFFAVASTESGCPARPGEYDWHRAEVELERHDGPMPEEWERDDNKYSFEEFGKKEYTCQYCKQVFTPTSKHGSGVSFGRRPVYDTTSGEIEAGCMYWATWYGDSFYWDNHKGPHLMVRLPNGSDWNIDSRASNCTMPNDRTHRCWVRHGDPEQGIMHVDKNGHTCQAGAGSIMMANWHGFLHNSDLYEC
jgi:hypothetical protein